MATSGACARQPAPLYRPAEAPALDDPGRAAWQKPQLLVDTLGVTPGMCVVDLGAGSGYMLPYLARAVGPQGKVYALDIQPEFLALLRKRVATEHLSNVVVVESTVDSAPVPELCDCILLLDSYRELEAPVAMLRSLKLRLKPTGRLFVVEALPDEKVPGPPLAERLEVETVVAEARGAGLVATQRFDILERQSLTMFVNAEEIEPGDPADPSDSHEILPDEATPATGG